MERYNEYKDSGVRWLGQIPSHWRTKRFANLFTGNTLINKDFNYQHAYKFNYGQLIPKGEIGELEEYREVYSKYSIIEKGDIIINGLNLNYDFISQRVACSPSKGIITSAYIVCRPRENVNYNYYTYLFKAMDNMKLFHGMGSGIRLTLSFKELRKQLLFLPPLPEQCAIVSYLDAKCEKCDKLIAGNEKQITLLQELKQRIIADAVTRGINKNVKYKRTNVSWLGEVPEHWETKRAKNIFKKEQRPVQDGDEIVTCFRDGEVTLRKNRRISGFTEATDYSHYQHICKGDLVIHQMDAFAGASGVSDSDGMGTPVLSVCTAKTDNILNHYYAHILRLMGKNGFILSLYRGIRERSSDFRFDTFAKQYLPLPPLSEQRSIVSYINEKVSKIDLLTSKLQKEIEHLKEYKQRLISDVVTGQIKVCTE